MRYFSFIIPVYNVEKYLERCIDSILNQSYENFEIILINDGSTDNSGIICDQYASLDSRIVVFHSENKGLSEARNKGIELSQGKYIIFLDSDDYWISDKLGDIAEICSKDDLDVVVYNYEIYDESIGKVVTEKAIDFKNETSKVMNGENYLNNVLNQNPLYGWYAWFYVIRKDMLIKSKLIFKTNIKYEDMDLMYKVILAAKKISVIDESILRYIVERVGSITYNINIHTEKDKLYVVKNNIKCIENLNINEELRRKLTNNMSCSYYSSLILCNRIKNREERKELLAELKSSMWVCKHTTNKAQKIIYHITKIVGVNIMSKILYIRNLIKDRV